MRWLGLCVALLLVASPALAQEEATYGTDGFLGRIGKGTAEGKFAALEGAGVSVTRSPAEMGACMQDLLGN